MLFRKISPKRPTVVRKNETVEVCYLFKNTGECLGPMCIWPRIGKCRFFNPGRAK